MKGNFLSSLETMDFGNIFVRQVILLGHFLCDRVKGVERFATHPVTSLIKYPSWVRCILEHLCTYVCERFNLCFC